MTDRCRTDDANWHYDDPVDVWGEIDRADIEREILADRIIEGWDE